jgi:hypothetical protein
MIEMHSANDMFDGLMDDVLIQQLKLFGTTDPKFGCIMTNNAYIAIDTIFRLMMLVETKHILPSEKYKSHVGSIDVSSLYDDMQIKPSGELRPIGSIESVRKIGSGKGNVIGDKKGNMIGSGKGNVIGDKKGNMIGSGKGNVIGDKKGNMIGSGKGNVIGDKKGNVIGSGKGNVIGNGKGNVIGKSGDVKPKAQSSPPTSDTNRKIIEKWKETNVFIDDLGVVGDLVSSSKQPTSDQDLIYSPFTKRMASMDDLQKTAVYKLWKLSKYLTDEKDEFAYWEPYLQNKFPDDYKFTMLRDNFIGGKNVQYSKDAVKSRCEFLTAMGLSQMRLRAATKLACKRYVLNCLHKNGFTVIDLSKATQSMTWKKLYSVIETDCGGRILDISMENRDDVFSKMKMSYVQIEPFMNITDRYFNMSDQFWIDISTIPMYDFVRRYNKLFELKLLAL